MLNSPLVKKLRIQRINKFSPLIGYENFNITHSLKERKEIIILKYTLQMTEVYSAYWTVMEKVLATVKTNIYLSLIKKPQVPTPHHLPWSTCKETTCEIHHMINTYTHYCICSDFLPIRQLSSNHAHSLCAHTYKVNGFWLLPCPLSNHLTVFFQRRWQSVAQCLAV